MNMCAVHWIDKISEAIETSNVLVFIASKDALSSKWVRRELKYADDKSLPIIPVVFGQVNWPRWYELQFGHFQKLVIDQDTKGISLIVAAVKKLLKEGSQ